MSTSALEGFAGGPLPASPGLPLSVDVVSMSGARAADAAVILAVVGVAWLVGIAIQKAGTPRLKPWMFAATALAIFQFAAVNPVWWQTAGVDVDAQGITVRRYSAADQHLDWAQVTAVSVDPGRTFPVFTDDAALVLTGAGGDRVVVPRFVPRGPEIAAAVDANVGNVSR